MNKIISVSLGESMLKGKNRKFFEDQQIQQIRKALEGFTVDEIYKEMGKIYIRGEEDQLGKMMDRLTLVSGLAYISLCVVVDTDESSIKLGAKALVEDYLAKNPEKRTFKVETHRADKNYPLKSPEVSRRVGGYVLHNVTGLKVDVHNPDFVLHVDVKQRAYVYIERLPGVGGLPIGMSGKGLLLLSGGIDSPVAGYIMAKRGMEISGLHFHSYPFTPMRSLEKIKQLAKIMSRYTGDIKIHAINLLPIQEVLNKETPEAFMTILSRRFMMRIGESLAKTEGYQALITGESLGQVASQTIEGLTCINAAVNMPILRPLIGMDKVDIIDISRKIETYETSILPYEDSCSVFLPKRPVTKPVLKKIEEAEKGLEVEQMIADVIDKQEIFHIS